MSTESRRFLALLPMFLTVLGIVGIVESVESVENGAYAANAAGTTDLAAAGGLTLETIMARDWVGTPPTDPYWSDDGKTVYFHQKRVGSDVVDLYRLDPATGRSTRVEAAELGQVDPEGGAWSRDRKLRAFIREGDLFVKESGRKAARQLTRTAEIESAPVVLTSGSAVAFRRGDAFHAIDLESGLDSTIADLQLAKDPAAEDPEPGFLKEQQLRYFDVLRARKARKDEVRATDLALRAGDPTRSPLPIYLGEKKVLLRADLSPSGAFLFVALGPERAEAQSDPEGGEGGKEDGMPVYITESGYVETRKIRPKVGTNAPETPTLLLVDLAHRRRIPLDLAGLPGLADDPLVELRHAAEARKKSASPAGSASAPSADSAPAAAVGGEAKARPLRITDATWNSDGSRLALQFISEDNKDRWIALANPSAAKAAPSPASSAQENAGGDPPAPPLALQPLHHESDPAWLGWRFTDFGWMKDDQELWFLSEMSGYSHLYLQRPGSEKRAVTEGPFEVDRPLLSRDGKSFFVSANRESAGIYEAYRVPVEVGGEAGAGRKGRRGGGELERLTETDGMTYAVPSPDEKQLLLTSSWPTHPPELYVQAARAGATAKKLTATTSAAFAAVQWSAPEIVRIPSTHWKGVLQARVYTPAGRSSSTISPAVVFIHGAGYLQNAHQGWSDYYHEFMFHTLLTRLGYVVLDMDYRASSGYGRDFRTAIYRQMGWPEVEDLEDGVDWLVANRGVDAKHVGTYGGSYGGFLTMMALFRKPELFAAGAALRPVTDWAHYNHSYTSAILNTPEVDPEAYSKSSPIEYASGLARPLLICHGMVDDNVAFQDTVRLVQRLIELGKTDDFETAIFPFEPHGFKEPTSWVDEYKRILRLFETNLK
ncbi:MAG: prolyl oligopeptidase family serine peptidase [Thermoanaerobaculia bacterium]